MLQRNDPFDGQMSLEDVQGLSNKQSKAPAQPQEQEPTPPKAEAPAPKPTPEPKPLADIVPKNGKTLMGTAADQVVISPPDTRLAEEVGQHAVFTFGRFNPPTTGHEKLVHATERVAAEHKVPAHIITSHSDSSSAKKATRVKNPLPLEAKMGYLKKIVSPKSKLSHSDSEHPSVLEQAAKLHKQGVTHLHMVAGSDRVEEYHNLLHKYNGTHEGALYNFKHITVHSAGHRDPDAEGTEGMSGTKMRAAAKAGDTEKFKSGLPKALHKHANEIADHIRNVKEDADELDLEMLDETVASITTRMHRAVAMRKNKARMSRAREIARRRLAKQGALSRRAMKKAKSILRTRLAGTAGASYSGLTVSQKIAIDKQVERRKGAVKNIARKIAPRIRGDEMRRLQSVQTGKKFNTSKMVVASYEIMGNMISEKEHKAIVEKAAATGFDVNTLLAVFNRGKSAWSSKQPPGKTPSQYGFDRLNSFINGGKAFKEDVDLTEGKTVREILARGMHTPRHMGDVNPDHIPAVHPQQHHNAAMADAADDGELEKKKKRANIIRRKTTEYVRKVVETNGTRDTVSPSLMESVSALIKKAK